MKHRLTTISSILSVVVFASVASAQPATCDTTYDGPNDGAWQDSDHWDGNAIPDSTDVACIPVAKNVIVWTGQCDGGSSSGEFCEIDGDCPDGTCDTTAVPDAECEALNIFRSGETIGEVEVVAGASIILHGPSHSTIDGILNFYHSSASSSDHALKIADDITIVGEGGRLLGDPYHPYSTIESVGGDYVLTLEGVNNSSRNTSIALEFAWVVEAGLENNGYVVANAFNIKLNQAPVSGSGYWVADREAFDSGTLHVNVEATGGGTWRLENTYGNANSTIVFNADCPDLTGDFVLEENGTVEVNADVVSTGHLQMESISDSTPQIQVAAGASIEFNASP